MKCKSSSPMRDFPPLSAIAHDRQAYFLFPVVSTMVRSGVLHVAKNLYNINLIVVRKKWLECLIKSSALTYVFCVFSGHWYLPQERPQGPSHWAQVARYLFATTCEGKLAIFLVLFLVGVEFQFIYVVVIVKLNTFQKWARQHCHYDLSTSWRNKPVDGDWVAETVFLLIIRKRLYAPLANPYNTRHGEDLQQVISATNLAVEFTTTSKAPAVPRRCMAGWILQDFRPSAPTARAGALTMWPKARS